MTKFPSSENEVRAELEILRRECPRLRAELGVRGVRIEAQKPGPANDLLAQYSALTEHHGYLRASLAAFDAASTTPDPGPEPTEPPLPVSREGTSTNYTTLCRAQVEANGAAPLRQAPDGAHLAAPEPTHEQATGYTAACLDKQKVRPKPKLQTKKPIQEKTKPRNWTEICEQARIETQE